MSKRVRKISLALQGGGAHGAFTWGVLDRLLEDDRLEIEAITGTSAGAMNALVLAEGLESDGRAGARRKLESFWEGVSHMGRASLLRRTVFDIWSGNWSLDQNPAYVGLDLMSRLVSPYEFNPLNINPLRDLVETMIDFDVVRRCKAVKVFVGTTNVHTGKVKVFSNHEMRPDVVLASACLPYVFHAVEIDGVPYWDGGYTGNPPIYPLFYNTETCDVVVVQINPIERRETPKTAREIFNRVNEISFNSSLLREMRAIAFVTRLIEDGQLDAERYKRIHMHRIEADEDIKPLSASSKLNAEWEFLTYLRDVGRAAAGQWLQESFESIGEKSTLDLQETFS